MPELPELEPAVVRTSGSDKRSESDYSNKSQFPSLCSANQVNISAVHVCGVCGAGVDQERRNGVSASGTKLAQPIAPKIISILS